ncbi:MAG: hypothetical protein NTV54_16895 [Ignavibacteriales bacterium]|nr:hypothetical protein [Ignavibacteriales bacterium]
MHCGVTQPVRVLEKGSTQLSASLGGPIIKPAGFPMPVPYMTAGAVHGLTGDVSLIGRAHVTALLFGDLGLDAGAAYALAHERGIVPEITATGELYLFSDLRHGSATRGYPFLSLNASYVLTGSVLVFAGAEDVYQLRPARHFMTPFAGVEIPVSSRSVLQMEMKWMAANVNTAHGVFEGYSSIGGMGSFATFFGCTYRW